MNSNTMFKEYFKEYAKPMIIRSLFNRLVHTADNGTYFIHEEDGYIYTEGV